MPQNNSSEPPEVMTWRKATPVLVVCAIFDLLRVMFDFFWFFGPAFAGIYCVVKATDAAGAVGTYVGGALCGTAAIAAGVVGAVAIETFGVIMAMATGFAGWLIIGGWLMKSNPRIFKENALWFAGSLLVSEIPFVNVLPAMTGVVWKMYRTQIRVEEAAYAKWKKENATVQLQQQRLQEARLQYQAEQEEQSMQQGGAELAAADV